VRSDLLEISVERSGLMDRSGFGAKFDFFVNSIEKFFKEYYLC